MVLVINTNDTDEYQVQTIYIKHTTNKKDEIGQKTLAKIDLSRVEKENLL
jgi:hypothetical protein